jgi:hypothetical protein
MNRNAALNSTHTAYFLWLAAILVVLPAAAFGQAESDPWLVVGLLVAPNVLRCSTRPPRPLAIPLVKRCGTSSCSATESFHLMFAPSTREGRPPNE